MKATRLLITLLFISLLFINNVFANNLQITNVGLANDSTITFNISWDNSWRVNVAPNNHDATWIFIKQRDCASGQWSHVDLSNIVSDHSAASPLEVYIDGKDTSPNTKGLFLRRATAGTGNITNSAISLRLKNLEEGEFDFRVFGIEMVQIPQDSFYLGDGSNTTSTFRDGNSANPYYVTSEDSIPVGTAAGSLYASSSSYRPLALPAAYPKGYNEIYCMKYEISHGQYVDFTNLLNSDQAAVRSYVSTSSRHNRTGSWPNVTTTVPHRALSYLSWADFLAYLDWSALRPMTELEFEKICRGPVTPVANEYAWGTNLITNTLVVINDGTPNESCSTTITPGSGLANVGTNGISGPIRSGFAAGAATSRAEAGAGYYGVMEMSGNLYEPLIGTKVTLSIAFTGALGDGEISDAPNPGLANVANWPTPNAALTNTSAVGKGVRGGSWAISSTYARISDRVTSNSPGGSRYNNTGGRGVR